MIALLMTLAVASAPAPVTASCPAAVPFADGLRVVDAVRVVKTASGESDFVPLKIPAATHAYFRPNELFAAINFGPAEKVQIVSGPPNVTLPFHASLGYEMFLTVQGSSTVVLPNGREWPLKPGSLVIMEDMGSKTGHAGRTGPCGYVSVQFVPRDRFVLPR